ncbi:MAG: ATP-binding protein [Planctomycetes bacterium]|nr:ATP-binding protein [Planctomycetota bacterium]
MQALPSRTDPPHPPVSPRAWTPPFELARDLAEIAEVLETVETALAFHHFSTQDLFAVRLALDETLRNAIVHGNRLDASKRVWVYCRINSQGLEDLITDEGKGFDFATLLDPTAAEAPDEVRGCGLLLMRYYMDEVLFQPPGNTVRLIKRRTPFSKVIAGSVGVG